jgi:hypothetical protein
VGDAQRPDGGEEVGASPPAGAARKPASVRTKADSVRTKADSVRTETPSQPRWLAGSLGRLDPSHPERRPKQSQPRERERGGGLACESLRRGMPSCIVRHRRP